MKRVLILGGRLLDIVAPGAEFPVHESLVWVDASDDVAHETHEWDGVAVVPRQPRTLADAAAEKLAALSALRFQKETAGVAVSGATVKTDRHSQAALTGAYTSLKNGLVPGIDWKAAGGVWVSLTLAQVEPMAQAVAAHVQACFTAERAHAEAIAALATVEAVDAYDIGTGWPI